MADISISNADSLKKAVSWLIKVSAPSDIATICFHADGGMTLLASPSDGTIGLLSFGNGHHMDNHSWFRNLRLKRLQQALDIVNDDKVHFFSFSWSCIMKTESADSSRSHVLIPVFDPDPTMVNLASNRNRYPLKLGINTKFFSSIIKFFKDMDIDKVFFEIMDSQVTFTAGTEYEPKVLLRESTESVWIYPPDGELPAGLGCTVDAVCDTMLYSLKQPDPRIFRAELGKSAVDLYRAARLRTAVSLLPGNTATFKFQSNGVFIVASSEDRSLTAMLQLSNSNNFTCKQEEFFDININDLCRALEHGGDSDEVHISTHKSCLIMRIRDLEGQDTWKRIESDSVNLLNAKFKPNTNNYKVMASLRIEDFAHVCFKIDVDHKVIVTVSNGQVTISSEFGALILLDGRNGCSIIGFTEGDTSSYVAEFDYDSISLLCHSICNSSQILIYHGLHSSDFLSQVIPCIEKISFFFE